MTKLLSNVSIYQTTWRHIPEDSNLHFTTSVLDPSLTITVLYPIRPHVTDIFEEVWENNH
jgi:hypothetical protein